MDFFDVPLLKWINFNILKKKFIINHFINLCYVFEIIFLTLRFQKTTHKFSLVVLIHNVHGYVHGMGYIFTLFGFGDDVHICG